MLYAVDSEGRYEEIRNLPYQSFFDGCSKRLGAGALANMKVFLNMLIDTNRELDYDPDWTGVFSPIYQEACQRDLEASEKFLALLTAIVFKERNDAWSIGRHGINEIISPGMTYHRIQLQ